MKKIFYLVVISLFTPHLLAQNPTRTVNLTSPSWSSINKTSITNALSGITTPSTIWVAAGTYIEAELTIPIGVTVIGGFPSNATTLTDRIYPGVATNNQLSILDGSYKHRVATVKGTLDCFVITKGYVYDSTSNTPIIGNGGGVLINGGLVQNCILHDNIAAKLAPTPGSIPGTYVASIGDIFCTDSTLVEPTYSVNSNGKYVATLPSGYTYSSDLGVITTPSGTKTPLGIVFYVNPSATSINFLILGKPNSGLVWSNPYQNITELMDITSLADAQKDMNGATNTQTIKTYIAAHSIPINSYPALNYINGYPSLGTYLTWYMPASGEMLKMWEVYPQIDACAYLLNWETSTWFPSSTYWTSTEYSNQYEWILYANSYPSIPATLKAADQSGDANKTASNRVFPVASIQL